MGAITKEVYTSLSPEQKNSYISDRMQLEDFWLVGRVSNPVEDKPFFFIRQLINPYNGSALNRQIFTGEGLRELSIYCRKKKGEELKNGCLVAAKFKLSKSQFEIGKGNILETTFPDVHPIEDSDAIFDLIGMQKKDLGILALAKPSLYEGEESRFVDAAELIKAKVANDLSDLNDQQNEHKQQLDRLKEEGDRLTQTKQKLFALQNDLEKLGFTFDEDEREEQLEVEEDFLPIPSNPYELLKGIQEQIGERGFLYQEQTLRHLFLSLMTEQMVVLSGPSGTGKTTIVKQLAKVMNARYEIIPVQPSWTDKQDLLGFYNPMRRLYIPSSFLDCLIEAGKNKTQLYFICLDEMNLAQIEYYLADLLSKRELKGEKVRLYSDFEYKQNEQELKWITQQVYQDGQLDREQLKDLGLDPVSYYERITRFENLKRYPAELEIPDNVRIIGTMNVDGAVQAMSPKVIDRSFVVPMYRQDSEDTPLVLDVGNYNISSQYMKADSLNSETMSKPFLEALDAIKEELKNWDIEFNERTEKHIRLYYKAAKNLGCSVEQLVDDLTLLKLLPRIHDMVEQEQVITSLIQAVKPHVKEEKSALDKLEKMKRRYKKTGLYSYWS
ncbi:AAA family ATPase [Halobacillus sp. BAB-2008]|uniref:AAA family ATPase n=1 Tax=Halobacillus sp. BAB-2008 TaxID=1246484 RepID=UPI0002A501C5|nr:AAA family ATPase [Halobacillus sp. BAB-2008]ELK46304.1 GTPase subunit of restriction endonuclease [Halobacillus sp. BAB-2008]